MLHKAWNSKEEMPYCFPRSSIKFQGHTGQNITDFDPNWAFPDYRRVAAFRSLRFALLFKKVYLKMFYTKCQPFCLWLNGLTAMHHLIFTREVYPTCWGMVYLGQGLTYLIADGPGQVKLPVGQVGDLSQVFLYIFSISSWKKCIILKVGQVKNIGYVEPCLGQTSSIPCLLMTWLLALAGHKDKWYCLPCPCLWKYRKVSNIRRTLVGNKIVDHSDVVGASPVGAAPTTSSFST